MSMLDALTQAGGADAISRELGVDQQTAQTGMAALLPAVLGGMQNHAEGQPQGLGGLIGMLGGLGGGGLMDNATSAAPTDVSQGNGVLGRIFGNKDNSRAVADHAAQQTGLSPDLLKRMLPIVAMLAAGYFWKQAHSHGATADAGAAGGDPTGAAPETQHSGGLLAGGPSGLGGLLGGLFGRDGDTSNPLNRILGGLTGTSR
ncbi:DUF937 domain-containing protein [Sphingomonas ginkgonis]|uniref:DUF937 domain-containing protein n=1 Tax=Sphingomonas ginkgonis TaxID=2315330 RepID=A0A429VAP1_9SPHN|nr:DUF937 domain-containing protein [Sphingomonas ginkgonis]RST30994.1 DUF937 domain-containing protein [Sphingomonas ginkgonis]